MNVHMKTDTLEGHFERVFALARILLEEMDAASFPDNTKDAGFVRRSIAQLGSRSLLHDSAEGTLKSLSRMLRLQIAGETLETRRVFDGYHDPEIGDVGRVLEVAVLTDRGEMLSELLISLERLMSARNAALDRLCAELELRSRI